MLLHFYKKSTKKDKEKVEDLFNKFKKLNTAISIISRSCTSYIQLLDVFINKIIKNLIKQCKENYYNANPKEYNKGKYSANDYRVLVTH
jgi:hypothetical protein